MKAVLLFVVFIALFASASPLSCDNPFFRLLTDKSWEFPYLTDSAIQATQNQVCSGFNGQQSCCDGTVFNDLEKAWAVVRTEVIAVRVELAVLQAGVDALLVEIAFLKNAVRASTNFTVDDKADIITFLDGVAAAVTPLVPDILAGFVPCYSSVLKFYAGLLCRLCDPVWDDWVLLEGSNPLTDNFRLNFSQATCNGFTEACSPFFTPFYTFRNALLAALAQLARNVDNSTLDSITDGINDYDPPCDGVDDCLQFICYEFLSGLDRDEDWIQDSFNSTITRRDNAGSIANKFVRSLNAVQKSARQVVNKRSSDLSGTDYSGTFDPLTQQTTLNTDASTSPSSRISPAFWLNVFVFFL